jgi:hypothetical protein
MSTPVYIQYKDTCPPGVVDPVASLTDEKKAKLAELRKVVDSWNIQDKEVQNFVSDLTLFRFLNGLGWDVQVAAPQLKETCDWRASFKPENVKLSDVEKVAKQGYMYHFGYDKKFRPVIYLQLGKDKAENDEEGRMLKFKNVVWIMEDCIKKMPKGVYNITWIIDATNTSLTLSLVKQMKDMFTKLGDYYTERLAMAFVLNVPWTLSFIWQFIKMVLPKETVEKYQLISGNTAALKETFLKYIDESQLIEEYGGTAKFSFNFEAMLAAEKASNTSTQQPALDLA